MPRRGREGGRLIVDHAAVRLPRRPALGAGAGQHCLGNCHARAKPLAISCLILADLWTGLAASASVSSCHGFVRTRQSRFPASPAPSACSASVSSGQVAQDRPSPSRVVPPRIRQPCPAHMPILPGPATVPSAGMRLQPELVRRDAIAEMPSRRGPRDPQCEGAALGAPTDPPLRCPCTRDEIWRLGQPNRPCGLTRRHPGHHVTHPK